MKRSVALLACLTLVAASPLHAQRGQRLRKVSVQAIDPCHAAKTTLELNDCLSAQVDSAERVLAKYLAASRRRFADEPAVIRALGISQREWLRYRKAHCDAVYKEWADGTIRNAMAAQCLLDQTRERTHDVWSAFLTFMDSTPPVLPEPRGED